MRSVSGVAHRQRREHCTLRVVLPDHRHPKGRHDCVADELLDPPLVALDLHGPPSEIGVDDLADVLGVVALGQCREPGDISEEHRDRLQLLGGGDVPQRGQFLFDRAQGRFDHGIAQDGSLLLEGGPGRFQVLEFVQGHNVLSVGLQPTTPAL